MYTHHTYRADIIHISTDTMALFLPGIWYHNFNRPFPRLLRNTNTIVHPQVLQALAMHPIQPLLVTPPAAILFQQRPFRCTFLWHLINGYIPVCFMPMQPQGPQGPQQPQPGGDNNDEDEETTKEDSDDEVCTLSIISHLTFRFIVHITITIQYSKT